MKVVILAAGRSFRMQPIADKNFLEFFGEPLLAHQLKTLTLSGFKEIAIVGGNHNLKKIKKVATLFPKSIKITVLEQKNLDLGMAGAVQTAKNWIKKDAFVLVSANDCVDHFSYELAAKWAKKNPEKGALVAKKVRSYFPGGYLKVDKKNLISRIVEKPGQGKEPSDLVNIVIHYHPNPELLYKVLEKHASANDDSYERALQDLLDDGAPYFALPSIHFWQPLKYPWHALGVMNCFLNALEKGVKKGKGVEIAKTATIKGNVYLADGVRVLDNAVISGPAYIGKNTIIATSALVRGSQIGENCVIGFGSEIARSYVGNEVWTHTNYIGDSVIGNNVSFGAGTVTGNLRLDEKTIKAPITKIWNGTQTQEVVDTGLTKLGLITGDNIRVGINTSFMPGVKVGNDSFIGAGITIAQDIAAGSYVTGEWTLKIKPNREKITKRQL